MKVKWHSWRWALTGAAGGALSSIFTAVPRSCTGMCGSCGASCSVGFLVGLWIAALYLFYRLRAALHKIISAGGVRL